MGAVRKRGEGHIKKQIDRNTWLLGNFTLRRSPDPLNTPTPSCPAILKMQTTNFNTQ
jgi:hypothetical protein